MRFRLHKKDGKVSAERNVADTLTGLADGSYWLEIEKISPPKTLSQLAYFHGPMLLAIAEESGCIREGMSKHEIRQILSDIKTSMKRSPAYSEFFPNTWRKDPLEPKKRIVERKGMADMDKERCRKFLDAVIRDFPWIPPPDTGKALAFYDEMIRKFGKVSAE